jgi:hypothetical protein
MHPRFGGESSFVMFRAAKSDRQQARARAEFLFVFIGTAEAAMLQLSLVLQPYLRSLFGASFSPELYLNGVLRLRKRRMYSELKAESPVREKRTKRG